MAATAVLFENKSLELVKDVEEGLPEIDGDRDRLVQVVINLISNAVKFTERGSVTCRARLVAHPQVPSPQGGPTHRGPSALGGDRSPVGNSHILVSVIDTGAGIDETDRRRIFDKFMQGGDTLTDKPQGTGLGLPICKEIVEHHGGRIWVESEPGHGSTFSFTLPLTHLPIGPPSPQGTYP
jgi:signal transduction histidine kinase